MAKMIFSVAVVVLILALTVNCRPHLANRKEEAEIGLEQQSTESADAELNHNRPPRASDVHCKLPHTADGSSDHPFCAVVAKMNDRVTCNNSAEARRYSVEWDSIPTFNPNKTIFLYDKGCNCTADYDKAEEQFVCKVTLTASSIETDACNEKYEVRWDYCFGSILIAVTGNIKKVPPCDCASL